MKLKHIEYKNQCWRFKDRRCDIFSVIDFLRGSELDAEDVANEFNLQPEAVKEADQFLKENPDRHEMHYRLLHEIADKADLEMRLEKNKKEIQDLETRLSFAKEMAEQYRRELKQIIDKLKEAKKRRKP